MPQTNIKMAKARAIKLGVKVEASKSKNKKLDVFKNGKKVASIGDKRYSDYLQHNDPQRRASYKARHTCRGKVGTPCYYADNILW